MRAMVVVVSPGTRITLLPVIFSKGGTICSLSNCSKEPPKTATYSVGCSACAWLANSEAAMSAEANLLIMLTPDMSTTVDARTFRADPVSAIDIRGSNHNWNDIHV